MYISASMEETGKASYPQQRSLKYCPLDGWWVMLM